MGILYDFSFSFFLLFYQHQYAIQRFLGMIFHFSSLFSILEMEKKMRGKVDRF